MGFKSFTVQVKGPAEFSASTVPMVVPIKPDQTNFTDCGIYLLHYVEKIFTRLVAIFR